MQYRLLLHNDNKNTGVTAVLDNPTISSSHVAQRMFKADSDGGDRPNLLQSAQQGGEQAYYLLWSEGYVREKINAEFDFGSLPGNIDGRSCELLFALAVLCELWPQIVKDKPALAATGIVDQKGQVQKVNAVPEKLRAALDELPSGGLIFYPRSNEAEIGAELIEKAKARNIQLFPVERVDEAAVRLGVKVLKIYLDEPPYRGLERFEYRHRAIYFGRQREIGELRERLLLREVIGNPGMLIPAASGAGKSSLVRAGLIPALEEGPKALADRPIIWAIWRPGDAKDKYEAALVRSILDAWQEQPGAKAYFAALTATDTLAELADRVAEALPKERRFFWLIDQFEEFFTAGYSDAALKNFAVFLNRLQGLGVWPVATLRADFYDRFLSSPFLRRSGGEGVYNDNGIFNLAPLDAAALDQIIKGPAELAGLSWEIDTKTDVSLADRLRTDMGEETDALPLLEFALENLYVARKQGQMRNDSYEASKGLKGAIGTKAEEVFNSLPVTQQKLLPTVLSELIQLSDDGTKANRRRARRNTFASDRQKAALVEHLIDERLLIVSRDHDTVWVELTHDCLLSQWPAALKAIEVEKAAIRKRQRLLRQAQDWKVLGYSKEQLLGNYKEVVEAELQLLEYPHYFSSIAEEYVRESMLKIRKRNFYMFSAFLLFVLIYLIHLAYFIFTDRYIVREYIGLFFDIMVYFILSFPFIKNAIDMFFRKPFLSTCDINMYVYVSLFSLSFFVFFVSTFRFLNNYDYYIVHSNLFNVFMSVIFDCVIVWYYFKSWIYCVDTKKRINNILYERFICSQTILFSKLLEIDKIDG